MSKKVNLDASMNSVFQRLGQRHTKRAKEISDISNLKSQAMFLPSKDMEIFLNALKNPPEPNEKLKALLHGERIPNNAKPHKFISETTSGIGFCSICYSDDINDGCHITEGIDES